ncbi:MAG TPA: pentapeptide repeat-containing protein [Vitreimonas sp.]|uniref:pentapeptide repeat-containing protein n=1 Tax=Vitreimonas sp. TaxID=3069702 RepID=UPI002D57CC7D|nr:pentapeptide repeat-containing protein [Vitreimonas sp.]HYD88379.1 pentapeptide repeat-containing protein [Vitreimonas sp.]
MKRAALFACLFALTPAAFAQAPSATGGPIVSQAERDATAERVRNGASCANCDLFQIDLAYQSIAGRDFSGARIRQANLSLATADRARFRGANMSLTNFFGARLTGADFTDANLEGATFVGAYLGGARLSGAALGGANFSGAELADALGLSQDRLNTACGDATTTLPQGMTIPAC